MMNPHFKNAVIAVAAEFAVACAMHCHAAVYEFTNKGIDQNLPASAPFGKDTLPGPSDEVYLSVLDAHKTLTLTNDWVSMISAVYFQAGNRTAGDVGSMRFVGTGYDFALPERGADDGQYAYTPLVFKAYMSGDYDMVSLYKAASPKSAPFRFTDADFTLAVREGRVGSLTFNSGTYNFYDPDGTPDSTGYLFKIGNTSITSIVTCANAATVKMPVLVVGVGGGTPAQAARLYVQGGQVSVAKTFTIYGDGISKFSDGADVTVAGAINVSEGMFIVDSGASFFGNFYMEFTGSTGVVSGVGTKFELPNNNLIMKSNKSFVFEKGAAAKVKIQFHAASSGAGVAITSGAVVTNLANLSISGSNAVVKVDGGTFWSPGYTIGIGNALGARLEVKDGTVYQNTADGMTLGHSASATVDISGGTMTVGRLRMARGTGSGPTLFRQTGGKVTVSSVNGKVEFFNGCTAVRGGTHTLQLDGGEFQANSFSGNKTYGDSVISADGGKIRAQTGSTSFLYDFKKAEVGAKGLVVDTAGFNVTQAQPFTNKEGAHGRYVKAGNGTLTLSATSWDVSETAVAGGTLKLPASATLETALVVTNGGAFSLAGTATKATVDALAVTNGVLALDPGDVIEVKNAISLRGATISWSSVPTSEQTVFVVDRELTADEQRMIRTTIYENALSSGTHATYTFSYDPGTGKTTVTTSVAEDEPLSASATWTGSGAWATPGNWSGSSLPTAKKIAVFGAGAAGKAVTVASGDEAGAISFEEDGYVLSGSGPLAVSGESDVAAIAVTAGSQEINSPLALIFKTPVSLAAGTTLTLGGTVSGGAIEKSGTGKLVLGAANAFDRGLTSSGGKVVVKNGGALGADAGTASVITGGTLEFDAADGAAMDVPAGVTATLPGNGNAIVLDAKTDVALADFKVAQGCFVKKGAGTMTLEIPANTTRTLVPGGKSSDSNLFSGQSCVFPEDGSEPTLHGSINVAEGELVIRGLGAGARLESKANGCVVVALPVASVSAQSALTVDNAYFGIVGGGSVFLPGFRLGGANVHSTVRIVNGATLEVDGSGVQPGYSGTTPDTFVTFAVTNGTYKMKGFLSRMFDVATRRCYVEYLTKDSDILGLGMTIDGGLKVDAVNTFWGEDSNDGLPGRIIISSNNRSYGECVFRAGSTFAISNIAEDATHSHDLTFAFDDAEWLYDADRGTKTWPASTTGHLLYEMRGTGVILKPTSGATFTTLAPFTGTGGLVVDGEGTVAFGANTAQFTGTLDVRRGTADFSSNGGAAAFTAAKGAGTVSGATMGAVTLPLTLLGDGSVSNVLTFANCTFGGTVRVDLGFTEESPLAEPYPQDLLVARYTGTAPDVGRMRLSGTGRRNLRGTFTAVGGEVRMSVAPTGMMMIVY